MAAPGLGRCWVVVLLSYWTPCGPGPGLGLVSECAAVCAACRCGHGSAPCSVMHRSGNFLKFGSNFFFFLILLTYL